MIDHIKKKYLSPESHLTEVLKKSSHSLLINIGGLIGGLLLSIFLGQALGVEGFGIISLAVKIGSIILIFCLLGMKRIIVKEVAIGVENERWAYIHNVMRSSYIINGGMTLIITTILALLAPYLSNYFFNDARLSVPLIIITMSVVPQVFSKIFSSGLLGFNKIWQGNFIDQSVDYLAVGGILLALWFSSVEINIVTVAISYLVGRFIIVLGFGIYYREIFSFNFSVKETSFVGGRLLKTSLPLLLVGASGIIASNADSIMIGWLSSSHEVGLYVVAARVALLTSLLLQVTNSAVSPKIAAFYSKGEQKKIEELVQKITALLIVLAIVPLAIFFLFGSKILSVWGSEFSEGYWILIILSIGQLFNLSTGSAGLILMLCGQEKLQGLISISFVILNLILNYFFILYYGVTGAAFATAITVAGKNIMQVIFVKKNIGISTLPTHWKYFSIN